eukprot:976063-Heterocapsa_arctica.AAC.1
MAQSGSRPIAFCCAAGRESQRWEETKCGAWEAPGIVGTDPTQGAVDAWRREMSMGIQKQGGQRRLTL